MFTKTILAFIALSLSIFCYSQEKANSDTVISYPSKLFLSLGKRAANFSSKLDEKAGKYLDRLARREKRLFKKLQNKDSALAKKTFGNIDSIYSALKVTGSKTGSSLLYSGHLDSLKTAIAFLDQGQLTNNKDLQLALESYSRLQSKFNVSQAIKKQLQVRQKLLRGQFDKLGMLRQLKGFQKDVYYYSAQVKEYKKTFEDPSKLEQKVMALVLKTGLFKDFFRKNSDLGRMFAIPGGQSSGATSVSLVGLQTRASVGRMLTERFGSSAATTQVLRDNVQAAQEQLSQVRNKLTSRSSGSFGNGSADATDFKPNSQKTKSFKDRLELGTNFQTQRGRYYFPTTSDIGLSLGYRLNDKSIVGIGTSYKLGLGRGWGHISLTHQGIGLRSYVDYKFKGNLYFSGGYEQNYFSAFNTVDQLKDYCAWQSSGLLGLSKRYQVNKKFKGEMKLLWDFLSYQQIPRTQAILFRIGYSLK